MNHLVAMPIDNALAASIGKKGTEGSMIFYNRKVGDGIVTVLAPADLEGKFHALPNSLILAEQIVISTASVDRAFGEAVVAASLLKKRTIFTKDNDVSAIISGTGFEGLSLSDKDGLLDAILSYRNPPSDGPVRVEMDRSFNVKGVGTVLLGIVTRGVLRKHDKLYSMSGKEIIVRSIQCQDEDVNEAGLYARVGIAAKGIDEKDVNKGELLSTARIPGVRSIDAELRESGFAKEQIGNGAQYQLFTGFGSCSCVVSAKEGANATLALDKELQIERGDTVLLGRQKQPRIFASCMVR